MAAHRYWRWWFTEGSTGYVTLSEVELRTSLYGDDQAIGGAASADSLFSGSFPASNAFDNNESTQWTSGNNYPHWLQYDFGSGNEKEIVQYLMRVKTADTVDVPYSWLFQYSDNGTDWTTAEVRVKYMWTPAFSRILTVGEIGYARVPTLFFRRDIEDGGPFSIIEPVTRLNSPTQRRVRLCDQRSGRIVREGWSDPVTGLITFTNLRAGPWILYALDHTLEFEAVAIADRLATVDGLR